MSMIHNFRVRDLLQYGMASCVMLQSATAVYAEGVNEYGTPGQSFSYVLGPPATTYIPTPGGDAQAVAYGGDGDPAVAVAFGGNGGNGGKYLVKLNGQTISSTSYDGREGGAAEATATSLWGVPNHSPFVAEADARGGDGGSGSESNSGDGERANSAATAIQASSSVSSRAVSYAIGGSAGPIYTVRPPFDTEFFEGGASGDGGTSAATSHAEGGVNSLSQAVAQGGSVTGVNYGGGFIPLRLIPGVAGSAIATATGLFTGDGGRVEASAGGGYGGGFHRQSSHGTTSLAVAHGETTAGGITVVTTQRGGDGGQNYLGGVAGNGADAVAIDRTTGSAPGHLSLFQSAYGGRAGSGSPNGVYEGELGGTAGHAGNATSILKQTNTGGGDIRVYADAWGGTGGRNFVISPTGSAFTPGSNGGDAVAEAQGTVLTGTSIVEAFAYGGADGYGGYQQPSDTRWGNASAYAVSHGIENSVANASSQGHDATATAISQALNGSSAIAGATGSRYSTDTSSSTIAASATARGTSGRARSLSSLQVIDSDLFRHHQIEVESGVGSTAHSVAEILVGGAASVLEGDETGWMSLRVDPSTYELQHFSMGFAFPADAASSLHHYRTGINFGIPTDLTFGGVEARFRSASVLIYTWQGPSLGFTGDSAAFHTWITQNQFSDVLAMEFQAWLHEPGDGLLLYAVVPEPSSLALALFGAGFSWVLWRRKRGGLISVTSD